jgi:predicted small secreted protein
MVRKALTYSLIAGSLLALAACNTVSGAGKDVASAGNAVSNTAEKSK